jgi:hypothetical protein
VGEGPVHGPALIAIKLSPVPNACFAPRIAARRRTETIIDVFNAMVRSNLYLVRHTRVAAADPAHGGPCPRRNLARGGSRPRPCRLEQWDCKC